MREVSAANRPDFSSVPIYRRLEELGFSNMDYYRILSLDGGGIRGILTVSLLERIEATWPGTLSKFDLFAGTSTGGLLALALASGRSPTEVRKLYEQLGATVFADSPIDNLRDLGTMVGAQYSIQPLKRILESQFGDMRLGELPKKVLISSFDLDNDLRGHRMVRTWKAKFFHNYPGSDSDGGEKVVDVAVRTSVAPTYFPIYQGYIDGGVVANNPSMCALAQALHPATGQQQVEDLVLLSISTGLNPHYLTSQDGDWGLVQWAPHVIDLLLEGSAGLADYQCKQVLDDRYFRINPVLPRQIGMDQVNQVPLLKQIASMFNLDPALDWLEKYFYQP